MRVVFYSNLFPSSREPTRGLYNLQAVRALANLCEVTVVCPVAWLERRRAPRELFGSVVEHIDGIEVCYPSFVPMARFSARLNPRLMAEATRPTLRRLERRGIIDVILAAWGYPDACAALRLSRAFDCPLVTLLLGSDVNNLAHRPAIRPVMREALQGSTSVIVKSHAMARTVTGLGVARRRIVVQHNGVNHALFQPREQDACRNQLGLPLSRPIVLYVGNLLPVKAPDVLLRAFAQSVHAVTPPPLLIVVGDGPLMAELQRLGHELGLGTHVRWVGRRRHAKIAAYLGAANVLCLPSRSEGCPNIVLEALASGRPVVATSVGALPELVTPTTGTLVPPDDVEALSVAIGTALKRSYDPSAICDSVAHLTWDAFADTIYRRLRAAVVPVEGHQVSS